MHDSAYEFVRRCVAMLPPRYYIAEFGSRDVNGSVRLLFKDAHFYVGVDLTAGPGVDEVADAADWKFRSPGVFDTIVSTEMLEHTLRQEEVIANAYRILNPGGVLILTAATDPRKPHSAVDGCDLRPGEPYRNVSPADLRKWLRDWHVALIDTFSNPTHGDVYALAVK